MGVHNTSRMHLISHEQTPLYHLKSNRCVSMFISLILNVLLPVRGLAGLLSAPGVKLSLHNYHLVSGPVESTSRSWDLISQVVLRAAVATNGSCIMWLLKCMSRHWFICHLRPVGHTSPRPAAIWLCWAGATALLFECLDWGNCRYSDQLHVQDSGLFQ